MKQKKWPAIAGALALLGMVVGIFDTEGVALCTEVAAKMVTVAEVGEQVVDSGTTAKMTKEEMKKKKKKSKKSKKSKKKKNKEKKAEEEATPTAAPTKEDQQAALDAKVSGSYLGQYANDRSQSGNFRYVYESDVALEDIVADYYAAYFGGENETHILINKQLGTTARVRYMWGIIDVWIYGYDSRDVDDVKTVPGGALMRAFQVNTFTGETTELDVEDYK